VTHLEPESTLEWSPGLTAPPPSCCAGHGAARVDDVSEPVGTEPAPPLEQSEDDTDRGWGERPDEADDDERIAREKPPHY
jgi:hypothetical protein